MSDRGDTPQEILAVAREVLEERGFVSTTMTRAERMATWIVQWSKCRCDLWRRGYHRDGCPGETP